MARPGSTLPVVGVWPWRTIRIVVGFGLGLAARFFEAVVVREAAFCPDFVAAEDADFLRVVVAMIAFHATESQPTVDVCSESFRAPKELLQ